MSAVWYTADTHFSHDFLAKDIRKFDSTEEHDQVIIDNWNACVKPEDTVWHLGDFTLKSPQAITGIFQSLNGHKHLIAGNHDRCFSGIRGSERYLKLYYDMGWQSVQSYARKRLDGIYFMMSHLPYSGDHGEDRYPQYRLRNLGLPIVHGHTHSDQIWSYDIMTPQIHVGMDATNLRPVHQEELLDLLREIET